MNLLLFEPPQKISKEIRQCRTVGRYILRHFNDHEFEVFLHLTECLEFGIFKAFLELNRTKNRENHL